MNLERYEYDQLDEFTYRFYSVGRNGIFEMRVKVVQMGYNSYNLGFGVVDPASEWLDDLVELRNGDTQTILSTVASIALEFVDVILEQASTLLEARPREQGSTKWGSTVFYRTCRATQSLVSSQSETAHRISWGTIPNVRMNGRNSGRELSIKHF